MNFPILEIAAVLAVIATASYLIDWNYKKILGRYYKRLELHDIIVAAVVASEVDGCADTLGHSALVLEEAFSGLKIAIYELVLDK